MVCDEKVIKASLYLNKQSSHQKQCPISAQKFDWGQI